MSLDDSKKLHIVVFPWLAFGHMIPFLELSKFLTQKGHRISFLSTPSNNLRLLKVSPNLSPSLNFVNLPLPYIPNLPENGEATHDVPYDKVEYLKQAFDGLQGQLRSFLEATSPDWIIYDFAPYWLPPIIEKFGISSAYFSIFPANVLCFCGPPLALLKGKNPRTEPEHFTVPPEWFPFPSNMAFRKYETAKLVDRVEENISGVSDLFQAASATQDYFSAFIPTPFCAIYVPFLIKTPYFGGCDVLLVRSCEEFDTEWLHLLEKISQKQVIPVGLLPPSPVQEEKQENWVTISKWLDKQKKESVVYIAFGSEATPSEEETTQLALGLELSQLPFIWVWRKPPGSTEEDFDMLPAGFEQRTRDHGIIWREWAPQLSILRHSSIGGFLTHCGWSSVIESLSVGCPLVLFPLINDQALIARMLEWKNVSVEIPRDEEDGSFCKESVAETLKMVIVDKEGEPYRTKAKALRGVFGDQVYSIAHGIELANLPFFWALRKPMWAINDDDALPLGFSGRTAEFGMVYMGWAPQLEILAHPSVGGSLFHSGWGSIVETLQHGLTLVVLPLVIDQGLNARFLVEKCLAVEVDTREEDGRFDGNDVAKALRMAMVDEEGERVRLNCSKMKSVFGNDLLNNGYYLGAFVQYLRSKKQMADAEICL